MTDAMSPEEARIAAWRSERGRFAGTVKAARIARQSTMHSPVESVAEPEVVEQKPAPMFLRTVNPTDTIEPIKPIEEPVTQPDASPSDYVGLIRSAYERVMRVPPFVRMVIAPTVAAAIYLFGFATPLYEAQSVIAITKSSDAGSNGSTGLLGGMERPSNLTEVFRADEYIKSQALMDSLEIELGLVSEFSSSAIDPIRRLRTIPILSQSKLMQFDRFVESSIDVQSGLLKLHVRAPDKEQAIAISQAVLRNAEIQVSQLGEQLFDNRETLAARMRENAERQVAEAQAALVALQLKYQEVDPRFRIEGIYARIKDLENQAQELQNEIQMAEVSGVRNKARTDSLIEMESNLRAQIAEERSQLVATSGSSGIPLNNILIEYELASLNVEMAREAVKTAIEAQAATVQEAALNRSLFQVVVPPRTAETAVYPKIPGVLALVFVICLAVFAVFSAVRENRAR